VARSGIAWIARHLDKVSGQIRADDQLPWRITIGIEIDHDRA